MAPSVSTVPAAAARPLRNRSFPWVLGLAVVIALLLFEALFCGKGLMPADGILSCIPWLDPKGSANILLGDQYLVFIPQHEFVYQQFQQGHFPLWNPYMDCGVPNLASSHGALLFPLNLLLLPVSPFYAAGLAAFLKLFLAGWFTMLYLRQLGTSHSGAFLSGVVFSLSGFMIVWLGHPHVNSAMWLPLMLYLIERLFQCVREHQPVIRVCVGYALVFACMLLGGHPPSMIHLTLFSGVYFLVRWRMHRPARPLPLAAWWGGALVAGFLLAAPALLPFLEYDHFSSESASSKALQRAAVSLSVKSFLFYLLPHLSGSPTEGWQETMLRLGLGKGLDNFNERTGYVGILPLLLALYAVIRGRCWATRFYAVVIPLCLLIIFGVPPFPAILRALPVLHAVHHIRLLLVVGFSVAVLAGIGWDRFQQEENGKFKMWITGGFWSAIGLVLLGCGVAVAPRWHSLETGCQTYLLNQCLMLGGSLLVSAALFLPSLRAQPGLKTALVLGWVAVDMLTFARGYNPAISHDCYYPSTPAIEWLKQNQGHARLLGHHIVLIPNTSEAFALRDARGCDFTSVRRYEELITGQAGSFFFYRDADSIPEAMPLLGVKYWLTFHEPEPDPSQFERVYAREISIYRYRQAHERAMVVYHCQVEPDPKAVLNQVRSGTFDPEQKLLLETAPAPAPVQPSTVSTNQAQVRIVADEADSVTVEAELPQPGFLLLLDTYFPGWTATVNGQPSPIYRADYNFRAVPLPAGKSTVYFAYKPAGFRLGLLLAAIGGLLLGAALFWSRPRSRPPDPHEHPNLGARKTG